MCKLFGGWRVLLASRNFRGGGGGRTPRPPPPVGQKIIFAIGVLSVNVTFLAIGAYAIGKDPLADLRYLTNNARSY
ncbi:MAG: hypothetical protein LBP89_10360 [Helicobacteraceae bacterium]|nr:hypothetical protein [Helicobacteraceae bacterium]